MANNLTVKQQRFVDEFIIDCNATQAAIRAGYSANTAAEQGARLLRNANVQAAIQEAISKQQKRTEITADRVLQELAKLGFSNMMDYMTVAPDGYAYVDLSTLTREQAAAIQEITVDEYIDGSGEDGRLVKKVKVKLADKRGALELIGKHFAMFTDKKEVTGAGGGPVDVKITIGDVSMDSDDDE